MNSRTIQTQAPRHIAIIMDGNGRWAKNRHLPRAAGHKAGVKSLRRIVEHSIDRGLDNLTVFAFSSENWRRPEKEVSFLMELFMTALEEEVRELHENGVRLKFIGAREAFPKKLQAAMERSEGLTAGNSGLILTIAANYGGRWDITSTCRKLAAQVADGTISIDDINEELFTRNASMADEPEPDLFIRTGGESRVSNYLLWQIAYTELYFTDVLWPDFDMNEFDRAVSWYAERQRRFGRTSEQVEKKATGN